MINAMRIICREVIAGRELLRRGVASDKLGATAGSFDGFAAGEPAGIIGGSAILPFDLSSRLVGLFTSSLKVFPTRRPPGLSIPFWHRTGLERLTSRHNFGS